MINWHRLFGIFLTDYFTGSPYTVELEKDLSLQQQFLDIVILRKEKGEFQGILPDGLENLNKHNLLSYKSKQESFNAWALQELIGHYVNYRKQQADYLIPESEFNLYAVSTRFPHNLKKRVIFRELKQGVYELDVSIKIRLIVLNQIPKAKHNAIWHLFSYVRDTVDFGAKSYQPKSSPSSVVNLLYESYQLEGLVMPYTLDQFHHDVAKEHLRYLSAAEVLQQFSASEFLKQFSVSERLKDLTTDEILTHIPKEEILTHIPKEEILSRLSKEEIMAYLQQLDEKE